jgi:hypothetical protein
MGLATALADVDTAAGVAVAHADLIGAAERDQPNGAQNVRGDIEFRLTAGRRRRHVATRVGHQKDLVVLLVDEALDQYAARTRGRLPVDITDIVAAHVGSQVVELQAAAVQQRVAATLE